LAILIVTARLALARKVRAGGLTGPGDCSNWVKRRVGRSIGAGLEEALAAFAPKVRALRRRERYARRALVTRVGRAGSAWSRWLIG